MRRPLFAILIVALAAVLGGLTIHYLLNPPQQQTAPAQSSDGHA